MNVFEEILELIDGWVEDGTLCDLHGLGIVSLLKTNDYNKRDEDIRGGYEKKVALYGGEDGFSGGVEMHVLGI